MLSPETRPKLAPHSRFRVIDGNAVVIVQDRGEAIVLNEVGTRVLELLDGETTLAAITDRLEAEYEVERSDLEKDVNEFLTSLIEAGAVETSGS